MNRLMARFLTHPLPARKTPKAEIWFHVHSHINEKGRKHELRAPSFSSHTAGSSICATLLSSVRFFLHSASLFIPLLRHSASLVVPTKVGIWIPISIGMTDISIGMTDISIGDDADSDRLSVIHQEAAQL